MQSKSPAEIKKVYKQSLVGAYLGFIVLKIVFDVVLRVHLGWRMPDWLLSSLTGGFWVFSFGIAHVIACARCQRLYNATGSRSVETIVHTTAPVPLPLQEPVVLRARGNYLLYAFGVIFFILLALLSFWMVHQHSVSPNDRIIFRFGQIFFLICAILSLPRAIRDTPNASADERGISGVSTGLRAYFRYTVPWHQIATCELITYRGVTGDVVLRYPIFKDASGKVLMTLNPLTFLGIPSDERERFFDYIRVRLKGSGAIDLENQQGRQDHSIPA